MSIQLTELLGEMMGRKSPPLSAQPDRRAKAAEIVRFIRSYVGRTAITRWEFSRAGTVILYFGVIHHDPTLRGQTLVRIVAAAEKFKFPFRLFADGNEIAMEILSKI